MILRKCRMKTRFFHSIRTRILSLGSYWLLDTEIIEIINLSDDANIQLLQSHSQTRCVTQRRYAVANSQPSETTIQYYT